MTHREAARIKGGRGGLSLVIAEEADMASVIRLLRERVEEAPAFFRGAALHLETSGRVLTEAERAQLAAAVSEFGMTLRDGAAAPPREQRAPKARADRARVSDRERSRAGEQRTMEEYGEGRAILVKRTLRSGQSISYDGDVVIRGDVNPGAMVTAAGDIVVLGALRGVAHAGATGNADAVVIAFRLEPTQLRIAGAISRAPDGKGPRPQGPEIARVQGDTIVIEAYEP